jgi:hypothetical protein
LSRLKEETEDFSAVEDVGEKGTCNSGFQFEIFYSGSDVSVAHSEVPLAL